LRRFQAVPVCTGTYPLNHRNMICVIRLIRALRLSNFAGTIWPHLSHDQFSIQSFVNAIFFRIGVEGITRSKLGFVLLSGRGGHWVGVRFRGVVEEVIRSKFGFVALSGRSLGKVRFRIVVERSLGWRLDFGRGGRETGEVRRFPSNKSDASRLCGSKVSSSFGLYLRGKMLGRASRSFSREKKRD
jgi:hypothetical protein